MSPRAAQGPEVFGGGAKGIEAIVHTRLKLVNELRVVPRVRGDFDFSWVVKGW
jgi:hypothetical protein